MKMRDGSQQSAGLAARQEPWTAVLAGSRELQSLGVTSDPPPIWPFKLGLVLEVVCVCGREVSVPDVCLHASSSGLLLLNSLG